jgi:hypothetical protein
MPAIPGLERRRQEGCEFEDSLGCIVRLCLKTKQKGASSACQGHLLQVRVLEVGAASGHLAAEPGGAGQAQLPFLCGPSTVAMRLLHSVMLGAPGSSKHSLLCIVKHLLGTEPLSSKNLSLTAC